MQFKKGHKINLGKKRTLEQRARISENLRLRIRKPVSKETKSRISLSKKGKRCSIGTEFKSGDFIGEKHWNWKGGLSYNQDYVSWQKNKRNRLKRANGGNHSFDEWVTLKAQYNWTCPCCHKSEPEIKLTQDHIIPVSKGGSDNIENIQPLCLLCNLRKHTQIVKYIINN